MAGGKKKIIPYQTKAITTTIKFSSRASIKIGESFYTFECCEERTIPDLEDVDIEKERQNLWDTLNTEVDNQLEDAIKAYKK